MICVLVVQKKKENSVVNNLLHKKAHQVMVVFSTFDEEMKTYILISLPQSKSVQVLKEALKMNRK